MDSVRVAQAMSAAVRLCRLEYYSLEHLLVTLRTALGSAVKDGLVSRNVADLVDPPSVSRPQMKTFSPEQARMFLEAVAGDGYEALFATAIALGYRQGESLGLAMA